jgi:N-acetylneuraminate synthase
MRASPVDKNEVARDMTPLRNIFTKSVVARRNLSAGTVLTASDLAAKKPGTGIPGARLHELVGRRLRRAVALDELLRADDVDEPLSS